MFQKTISVSVLRKAVLKGGSLSSFRGQKSPEIGTFLERESLAYEIVKVAPDCTIGLRPSMQMSTFGWDLDISANYLDILSVQTKPTTI